MPKIRRKIAKKLFSFLRDTNLIMLSLMAELKMAKLKNEGELVIL